jgi:sporulation protein YlmC with PRC-barrel domain
MEEEATMSKGSGSITRLSDSAHIMADPDDDIRGRKVLDCDGKEIGKVEELLIDTELKKIRLLRVEHGGLFGVGVTPLYIPVEAIDRVTDDEVFVSRSRAQVADAPQYDPHLFDGEKYFAQLYRYYG